MNDHLLQELTSKIAALNETAALEITHRLISGSVDPLLIIKYSHKGMEEVGILYERGKYFISGLIMAGEIMQQISRLVVPLTLGSSMKRGAGAIVIGTVEGDIHFIGKDIFKAFLRGHGFTVYDLGVDVAKERYLSAVNEYKPDIVGFSCLINAGLISVEKTIAYLREHIENKDYSPAYIVGGHRMNNKTGKMVGADFWTTDSMEGVRLCQQIMKIPVKA